MTVWPTKDRVYVDGIDCPCRIQYGVDNGGMENDYITVAREDNGKWLTARIDQIRSAPNPTLDIEERNADDCWHMYGVADDPYADSGED
jgi:hypothetical protein